MPAIDTSFADFTWPKINGNDDSLTKIQKKGVLTIGTSNDWPYSFLDPKTTTPGRAWMPRSSPSSPRC